MTTSDPDTPAAAAIWATNEARKEAANTESSNAEMSKKGKMVVEETAVV
eukprot:CAMPEP_0198203486 /NCGR_PEP_ID=MMETSP1445-20131203/6779_1 /TAXON_ID=36898 /ORGANISM="Pyramimonas sp., Strain CCMP2087" /LENGTH=48 /DNA_ID= /DNA_START= /DNA_END= /DNA_ORIENTATION=